MDTIRPTKPKSPPWYRGTNVPMRIIRRFARQVAERFQPDKIILFGSYAYGQPHADSDVDILVVMPARNQLDQAVKIHQAILPPFPLDIIVRTPNNMKWRLEEGDSFLREVVGKGKVLYEKADQGMGEQGRSGFRRGHRTSTSRWKRGIGARTPPDAKLKQRCVGRLEFGPSSGRCSASGRVRGDGRRNDRCWPTG